MCVDVRKDFGVHFGGKGGVGEEELLLRQVLLVVHGGHAVFVWAGRDGGGGRAAPFPLPIRRPVGALGGRGRGAGGGAVFSALAEPEQHGAEDQDYSRGDAHDDRPGEGVVGWREYGRDGTLCVCGRTVVAINEENQQISGYFFIFFVGGGLTWKDGEEGAAEAVSHGVGPQADVHARVLLLGPGDEKLVEVGAVGPRPHLPGGQHHEAVVPHLDGGVVAALLVVLHALQPLDDRLHVAPDLALERRGASVVHRGVDRVGARQNGPGAGPLCKGAGRGGGGVRAHACRPRMSTLLLALGLQLMAAQDEYHM